MKNKCINLRGGRVLPKEHKDKMTSTGTFSPWDPPKPLPQKPVRVIKAAAPMRARPQLAPKPQLAGQDVTYTVDNDKIKETERMQDAATELAKTGSSTIHHEESGTAQSKSNTLGVIKKSGKVKKMVNQFDKVLGPEGKQITQMPPQYSKLQNGKPAKDMNSFSLAKEMTPYKKYNKARLVSSGETQVMLAAPERLAEGSSVSAEQDDKTEKCNETLSFHKSLESNLELEAPNQPGPKSEFLDFECSQPVEVPVPLMDVLKECPTNCPCLCHIQRPGMVLSWVPAKREEAEGEEDNEPFSDSSSLSNSQTFQHIFVVNEDPQACLDPSVGAYNESNDRTQNGILEEFQDSDNCKGYSCSELSDVIHSDTSSVNSEIPGNEISDSCTMGQAEQTTVTMLSYRSAVQEEANDVLNIPVCELSSVKDSEGEQTAAAIQVPPTKARICKPPRRKKFLTQLSSDKEEQPPAIPPRVPIKPPRPLHASSFPGWSGLDKKIPEDRKPLQAPYQSATHSLPLEGVHYHKNGRTSTLIAEESYLQQKKIQVQIPVGEDDQIDNGGSLHSQQSQQFRKLNTQRSTDWESRLQDEPLYQTYRQTVISKEIKRQTLARNVSKTSIDYNFEALDNSPERGRASPKTSQRSTSQQNTLWQDLPVVRDSGVLQKIDKEQIRLQESMFEVLTSEASYLRSLNVLIDHFMNSKELENTIIIREKKILFSNISKVKEVSESFLNDLKDRVDESILISDICDIIHCHAEHDFLVYIDYVRNQIYQEQTYSSLMEKNVAFATVICRLQELPQCQKLPLTSFLLLPFQRITRIKMLTENILKRTEEGSSREQNAIKALASVSKIIDSCNEEVGKMKQMEELIHIAKKIEFDKLKAIPIISQNRRVEKQGELSEIIQRGSMFGLKPKFTPVYLFLFTDLLLICKRSSEKYVALDYAHRSLVHVQDCSEYPQNAGMENCFYLSLLENHQGKTSERLLKAPTQSDMHRWIAAFPKPTNETNSTSDTVYEDWDCPQVQCVEAYTGQQADELTLEPTDIINVLRKTSEGWYEGIRLSDGQKGWFPGSYTDVISNEHVRMRNLRERYRVLQAARHLQKAKASDTKRKGGASY
ncbi:rho guanine nucleotide exchange factor 15 isoform X2 [Protopterus annectens]|uniref:rho guanine nucleotide exchange factor 15 isoform X2 n=1 Tax=Protopterus annectens TaxID=7888 RepID=UPI001CFC3F61|nr:rho guanine nucleotide exchange factor 15 isoform X2 [Protopterus annectens]